MPLKTAAIIYLGSSEFRNQKLASRRAFSNSKLEFERYFKLQNMYHVTDQLDLFASASSATEQVAVADEFVGRVASENVEYLFLIYVKILLLIEVVVRPLKSRNFLLHFSVVHHLSLIVFLI